MEKLTPMMSQYFEIKNKHSNCLLFFRLGDFYELFFDDALVASEALQITLTGRDCGQAEKAPMCGVPFHSADKYIAKLVKKGFKVAICEQIENPKDVKGIVKRDVVRIITAGTVIDDNLLEESKNNYVMSIYVNKNKYAIALSDITTGDFLTTSFKIESGRLFDEISKFNPSEIIINKPFVDVKKIEATFSVKCEPYLEWAFNEFSAYNIITTHFNIINLESFGIEKDKDCVCASGALLQYLFETQKNNLAHITKIKKYQTENYMILEPASRRNLELCENAKDREKKHSLLWVLDKTKTAFGARLLRKWLEQPLIELKAINKRLEMVADYKNETIAREDIKEVLKNIKDIERIMGKIVYKTANARDLNALKESFLGLPKLKQLITFSKAKLNVEMFKAFDTLEDISGKICITITDEPPALNRDGGIIKNGVNAELDKYKEAKTMGNTWLLNFENEQREKTGIKALKVKFNKVFGYFIEVTNSYLHLVPENYVRRQTVANGERYIIAELKEIEETILSADEKILQLENEIFQKLRDEIEQNIERIQLSTQIVATIDVITSLAEVAETNNYTQPELYENGVIEIKDGRHPVVELLTRDGFVSNDTFLTTENDRLSIITGPNMAGKSTYMRQIAVIVLMAQIGSFVPASSAKIGVVDRIFTRVGASDDLATGQSTFMVEMSEVANILNLATKNSLLILDEIGRGTSTFDGLSIAWAVLEHIAKEIGAKTLFATHYHEITELEGKVNGVKNYCITVEENGEDIVFLRKIVRGGADNSYGIQVAKLAGLPPSVINRSNSIMNMLNATDIAKMRKDENNQTVYYAKNKEPIERTNIIIKEILNYDLTKITPRDALNALFELQQKSEGVEIYE